MPLLQVEPALAVDINFKKLNHDKKPIDLASSTVSCTQVVQQHGINVDSFLSTVSDLGIYFYFSSSD